MPYCQGQPLCGSALRTSGKLDTTAYKTKMPGFRPGIQVYTSLNTYTQGNSGPGMNRNEVLAVLLCSGRQLSDNGMSTNYLVALFYQQLASQGKKEVNP